jgi:hypothetical protein
VTHSTALQKPARHLSDGGNVYFLHEGALFTAPILKDGSFGMEDASPVGWDDGLSPQNIDYCRGIESALRFLDVRNDSEGMD